MDALSRVVLDTAAELERRLVGAAPTQAVILGVLPNAKISFGSLASQREARKRHADNQRADFAPNAQSVRLTVPRGGSLKVAVSMFVYAGMRKGARYAGAWADAGEHTWSTWQPAGRLPPPNEVAPARGAYVRLLYEQRFTLTVGVDRERVLDLPRFAASRPFWQNPQLSGRLTLAPISSDGALETVELSLENTSESETRAPIEPTWFDVRMRVDLDAEAEQSFFCPLVRGARVRFQTVNCAVVEDRPSAFELGPIGRVQRRRRRPRQLDMHAVDRAADAIMQLQDSLTASGVLSNALASALQDIKAGPAKGSIERLHRTFVTSRADWSWRWHQLAFIALGLSRYRAGGSDLEPIVLNVPTAGGKTEAFVGLAMAIAALEQARVPVAIIKYPTKMLSREQLYRIARYLMHFEADTPDSDARGLGYFADRDVKPDETATQTASVIPECPICRSPWVREERSGSGRLTWCSAGHRLKLCVRDEVFAKAPDLPPLVIVATWDKFVAKHDKRDFARLFGDRSFISLLVFDEAHLIREEVGSLDSHFETAFLEGMRQGAGRYPLVVLSSATLAGIENHTRHLGLRRPVEFPPRSESNAYFDLTDEIQHVVLAAVPRGRTLVWALPQAFGEYLRTVEAEPGRAHLRVPMLYFPSYNTLFRAQETIVKEVGTQRLNERARPLALETFSRKRFDLEGETAVRNRVLSGDVHAVLSTNIASVGIDLPDLNGIIFYGVPTNVSEFIQALNRVGRAQPAVAVLVLDPYKERDLSYFSYLGEFMEDPDSIIEWVPINRFARNAIQVTFDSVAANQLSVVFGPQCGGDTLGMADKFRKWHPARLPDTRVIAQLGRAYRADDDPSGAYAQIVDGRWKALADNLTNNRNRGLDGYISNTPGVQTMRNLRMPGPRGLLTLSPAAEGLRRSGVRAMPNYQQAEVLADTATTPDAPDASA